MSTALTVYTANAASSTLSTSDQLYVVLGTANAGYPFTITHFGTSTGYGEIWAQGNSGAWAAAGSLGAATGHGFLLENVRTNLEGQTIAAGNWTPTVRLTSELGAGGAGSFTADIIVRASKRSSGGVYTTIITSTLTSQTIGNTATTFTLPATAGAATSFSTGDKLYIEVWLNILTNTGGTQDGVALNRLSNDTTTFNGDPNSQVVTPGYDLTPPVLATSPTTLSFAGTVGGLSPISQNSTLSETAGVTTAWTSSISYGSGSGWLGISPSSGTLAASGTQVVAFTCTTSGLSAGTYTATVTYTATTGGATATVVVTLIVTPPGSYSVSVNGAPVFVEARTLSIDSTIGKRSTAQFTAFLSDTSTHFQQYTPVSIYDGTNTLVFSGYISNPKEIKPGFQQTLEVQVQCIDQHFLADKRIVAASYVNRTHASIAQDIVNSILSTEGVSIGHITDEGSVVATLYPSTTLFPNTTLFPIGNAPGTLPTTTLAYCTVAQAMDALATAASVSGVPYYWSIDQNKAFWFVPYTYNYNATLIDGSQIDDGRLSGTAPFVQRQNPTFRDKQYILGGTALTVSQTESRKGDGTTTSWTMGYEIAQVPTVKVNTVTKTVGIKGIDTGKNFYWNGGDPTITQDSAGTVLISTDTLAVTYVGQYPTVIIDQNDAQIGYQQSIDGSTGIVEEVETDATITTLTDGYNKASYLLTRYGQQGIQLQFMTLSTGFAAGQLVTVNLPDFGLNTVDMLIENVHATDSVDGLNIWFQVTAIVGPYDISWSDFFKAIIAPAQSSTNINVGISQVLALQQVFNGGITLSATYTATVAACPIPNTTLQPNTTLFPC